MSDPTEENSSFITRGEKIAAVLGFVLVVIGMLNTTPSIPGLDQLAQDIVGNPALVIRKFPYEFLYPLAFVIMMTVVALKHSMFRLYRDKGGWKSSAGLAMDIALVVMAVMIAVSYLIEIDAVCLIDQFTGERAELIAKALQDEKDFAELYGLPVPNSVDDPACINTTGVWLFAIVGMAVTVFLGYNVRVWGFPLVAVAILIAAYTMLDRYSSGMFSAPRT